MDNRRKEGGKGFRIIVGLFLGVFLWLGLGALWKARLSRAQEVNGGKELRLTYITCTPSRAIAEAAAELKGEGIRFDLDLLYPLDLREERVSESELRERLERADAVILDLRGGAYGLDKILDDVFEESPRQIVLSMPYAPAVMPYIRLGSFSGKVMAERMNFGQTEISDPASMMRWVRRTQNTVEKAGKYIPVTYMKDLRNYIRFTKYLYGGGRENYANMFRLILSYMDIEIRPTGDPIEPKEHGIYHPDLGYLDDLPGYFAAKPRDPSRPTLGMLFFGGMHLDQAADTLLEIEKNLPDFNILPLYTDGFTTIEGMRNYFLGNGTPRVDAILSMQWFRLNGGPLGGDPRPTIEVLKKLDVPVFAPAMMFMQRIDDWERSERGLDMIETIAAITWPEMDGCIEPIPVCGLAEARYKDTNYSEVVPIPERVERVSGRIRNRVALREKPNAQKRIALIIYNYPPGEASLGSAAYLDTFASLDEILKQLEQAGYKVKMPEKELSEIFTDFHFANSGRWLDPAKIIDKGFLLKKHEYLDLFNDIPESARKRVTEQWGKPPGNVMTINSGILIPALELGNILVGIQPSRPPIRNVDLARAAHDRTIPPHHQYIAFYRWLEDVWKADALVHIGTHGLLEFMPGKELAPAREDFPDILIGNIPHFYLYHILNTSEATIAKRRAYATLMSYNSPPYSEAGLYETYLELDDLIQQYQASASDPARAGRLMEMVTEKAKDLNLGNMNIDGLHDELYRLKRSIIPQGLHIIGKGYDRAKGKDFLKLILRYDRGGLKSLERILATARGIDYNRILKEPDKRARLSAELEPEIERLIDMALEKGPDAAARSSRVSRSLRRELEGSLRFGLEVMEKFINNRAELESLLRALDGRYIEPGAGGDVIREPEVLPSGRNLFQFDPAKVPTELAVERGGLAAENTIRQYLEADAGRYPESVAVVLWGFETTGTGGETIGQVLQYLGIRVNRNFGGWDMKLELIPLSELKRPRIDCLVSMCGFFREMFPWQVDLLDRAFRMVSELDEPDEMNFIKKHSCENRKILDPEIKSNGLDPETAERIASARLFGPASGEYGTRMIPLIEDSVWDKEESLAEAHVDSMAYLHGKNLHAIRADEIYRRNLKRVSLVSQIIYSHDYDLVDLDHYYEFFGGLARSVEMECGKKPMLLFSDSRRELMETESAGRVLDRSIRSRLLNPNWIDSMLEHDWHGAQKVADRVQYLIGWSATTHTVPSWTYGQVAERFVFDEDRKKQLAEANPFATHELMERLMEAYRRGYWDATEEDIKKLEQSLLELDASLESKS